MIICWDNIEKLYLTKRGTFRKGSDIYVEAKCEKCGDAFLKIKSKSSIFCGKRCANLGKNNPRYGRKMSLRHRAIISRVNSGKRHPRYNKYLTDIERVQNRDYKEYHNWRVKVFNRDNYTCMKCKDTKGGNLVAHHIYSFSNNTESRTLLSNGTTLCKDCHTNFHNLFGYGGNTEQQFKLFMHKERAP